jgi:hypothetical protein
VDEQQPLKDLDAGLAGLSLLITGFSTFWSFYNMEYSRPVQEANAGWKGYMTGNTFDCFNDLAGTLGSLIGPSVAIYSAYSSIKAAVSTPSGPQSSVTIYGSKSVSAFGATSASLHSEVSVSVSSGLFASIASTVATSLSSIVSTTISGAATSMSGMLSTSMSSMLGTATVSGKTSAQLSSWGKVFVAGNDDVQLNSMQKNVYIHGNTGFYIGCASGAPQPIITPVLGRTGMSYASVEGYGMKGVPAGLLIGKMTYANKFSTPAPDNTCQISMDSQSISLKHGTALISVEDSDIYVGKGMGSEKIHLG